MIFKTRTVIEITDARLLVLQSQSSAKRSPLSFVEMKDITGLSEGAVAATLAEITRKRSFSRQSDVVVVIPRQFAILRALLLPSKDPVELRSMAALQVVGHSHYSPEEIVVDILPVLQTPDGFTRVISILVPKERAEFNRRVLKLSRLEPSRMTLSSIGILRRFRSIFSLSGQTALVINIDQQISEICLCDESRVFFLRVMVWGAEEFLAGKFDECINQLEATLAGYRKEMAGKDVSGIFILSSLPSDGGLCGYIFERIGIPAEYKNVTKDLTIRNGSGWPVLVTKSGYSVTSGLGEIFSSGAEGVDLMPAEMRDIQHQLQNRKKLIVSLFLFFAVLAVLGAAFGMKFFEQYAVLKQYESEIRKLKPSVIKFESMSREMQELKADLSDRVLFSNIMGELYRLLPQDISLLGISITGGKTFSLQGYARDSGSVSLLQKEMADSGVFANVTLDYVNKRATAQEEFNYFKITCQINMGSRI